MTISPVSVSSFHNPFCIYSLIVFLHPDLCLPSDNLFKHLHFLHSAEFHFAAYVYITVSLISATSLAMHFIINRRCAMLVCFQKGFI